MSKKHAAMWILVGWLIAYVFPPQRALAYLGINKGK
jgi:hypothetical protein